MPNRVASNTAPRPMPRAVPAPNGADTFVVIEKWESLDHLKAHAASPHMQAYAAKTRDLLANREDPRPLPRRIARASTGIHKTCRITRYFLYRRLWLSTSVYG